jgi:ketosteroid isomerase-like protein
MSRPSGFLAPILFATVLAASCGPAPLPSAATAFDLEAARKIIAEKNEIFTRAHVAPGDSATIDAMFTRDATVFTPGAEPSVGPAGIHDLTMEFLTYDIKEFREETTRFYGNEEFLIDEGTYVLVHGADNVVERGKYLNVWKQEDGTWKMHANIWNTSPPAAGVK